ncbi:DUF4364 family protein [Tissierella creatinini]|nr:DUF4364 family protein [Tissierella creatinini]TJX66681.1 DUF4364 family protein [Soehngenia saccharolytica]
MLSYNTEEIAQNKLLILYIIKNIPLPLTNAQLTELILEKGFMNFFALQQYLIELNEGDLIKVDDLTMNYQLLQKGEDMLELFKGKIPERIIQELDIEFNHIEKAKVKETQVVGDYYQKENQQYTVNLKLVENHETLFSLYFDVATEDQSKKITNIWKENTQSIYENILQLFINHKD